jgi:hypothetical protein
MLRDAEPSADDYTRHHWTVKNVANADISNTHLMFVDCFSTLSSSWNSIHPPYASIIFLYFCSEAVLSSALVPAGLDISPRANRQAGAVSQQRDCVIAADLNHLNLRPAIDEARQIEKKNMSNDRSTATLRRGNLFGMTAVKNAPFHPVSERYPH